MAIAVIAPILGITPEFDNAARGLVGLRTRADFDFRTAVLAATPEQDGHLADRYFTRSGNKRKHFAIEARLSRFPRSLPSPESRSSCQASGNSWRTSKKHHPSPGRCR